MYSYFYLKYQASPKNQLTQHSVLLENHTGIMLVMQVSGVTCTYLVYREVTCGLRHCVPETKLPALWNLFRRETMFLPVAATT